MLAIAVELLTDRYTATEYNDRDRAEWPPHPARLFMAMVATWADRDTPSQEERTALQWLEQQPAPAIVAAGDLRRREVVTYYVPGNDARALSRDVSGTYIAISAAEGELREAVALQDERRVAKAESALAASREKARDVVRRAGTATGTETASIAAGALEVLPEWRNRQARTFPTVVPDGSRVTYVWADAQPTEQDRVALDRLLGRVARLGHSSTLVSCRLDDRPPAPTLTPGPGPMSLRVPARGMVDRLEREHARHGGGEPRRLPTGSASYTYRKPATPAAEPPLLGGDWLVLRIASADRLGLARTLDVTRAVRSALMAHSDQPAPPFVSGHAPGAKPTQPLRAPHLAVVPLANVGHRHSDGALRGIALVLPRDAQSDDIAGLRRALAGWAAENDLTLTLPALPGRAPLRLLLEDQGLDPARRDGSSDLALGSLAQTLRRHTWCRHASRWVSVTPVALDRHPKHLRHRDLVRRDEAESQAAETIRQACVHAGLPVPVDVDVASDPRLVTVPAAGTSPGRGRHPAGRFPPYRAGSSGTQHISVHVVLRFPGEVPGPVLIGAGRYHGYGFCLPSNPTRS